MFSKKKKQEIRQMFREEFAKAFTRTLMMERGPRKQGDPEEKRLVEENWNLIDFIAEYVPRIEGAIRGMQETIDRLKNNINQNNEKLEFVGKALIDMEQAANSVALLSDRLKQLPEYSKPKVIELKRDESDSGA